MAATKQRFAFRAEYHDRTADIIRPYTLLYFPGEDEIEMVDMKNKRTFLKRTKAPPGLSDQLFVGGKVEVFSRLLSIVGYADAYTEKNVAPAAAYTFAMIKPNAIIHLGEIIDRIYEEGFKIAHMDMHILAPHDCAEFYAEHAGKAFFESLSAFMCSGPSIAMKLVAENAVERWRRVIGPTDSNEAKQRAPESLRAKFGVNQTVNAVHGADSPDSARRECEFFFSGKHKFRPTARLGSEGTLCLVKPHAVREGNLGKIVAHIQSQGYSITALVMLTLDHTDADEFLEVYRGVLPEYPVRLPLHTCYRE
eukprot:Rmarinus@m.14349